MRDRPEPDDQETDDTRDPAPARHPDVLMLGCGIFRPWDF